MSLTTLLIFHNRTDSFLQLSVTRSEDSVPNTSLSSKTDTPQSSVTGLLLAGVGHVTDPPDAQKNFLVVDSKTEKSLIESTFNRFTKERKDIGIVLINQHVCFGGNLVRQLGIRVVTNGILDCRADSGYG